MPFAGTPPFVTEGLSAAEERHTQVTATTIGRTRERPRHGLRRSARSVADIRTFARTLNSHRTGRPARDAARSLCVFLRLPQQNASSVT